MTSSAGASTTATRGTARAWPTWRTCYNEKRVLLKRRAALGAIGAKLHKNENALTSLVISFYERNGRTGPRRGAYKNTAAPSAAASLGLAGARLTGGEE